MEPPTSGAVYLQVPAAQRMPEGKAEEEGGSSFHMPFGRPRLANFRNGLRSCAFFGERDDP